MRLAEDGGVSNPKVQRIFSHILRGNFVVAYPTAENPLQNESRVIGLADPI